MYKEPEPVKSQAELAHRLHDQIQKELQDGNILGYKTASYDPYKLRHVGYDSNSEPLRPQVIPHVRADEYRRQFVKGPSCIREKFTSKYWRTWNKEKNLLEDISRKENHKNKVKEDLALKDKRRNKIAPLKREVSKDARRVCTFADPNAKKAGASELHFDTHLLGDENTPEKIMKHSLHRTVPKDVEESRSSYDPYTIENANHGRGLVGGSMSGKDYTRITVLTQACEFLPPTSMISKSKGSTFNKTNRFKHAADAAVQKKASVDDVQAEGSSDYRKDDAGHVFGTDLRFRGSGAGADDIKDPKPGPGTYEVPRLFDETNLKKKEAKKREMEDLIEKYNTRDRGLYYHSMERKPVLAKIAVFAQGCNRQEHVMYGMCLDGRCARRAPTDDVIIRRNDLRRLAGYDAVRRLGIHGEKLKDDMTYSQAMLSVLDDPIYHMTPLYAAAYKDDVATIRKLSELGVDPNIQHPDNGYTALHVAVFRCKRDAVECLLNCFFPALQIDLQDHRGDTPLHIAARGGFMEITSSLCQAEDFEPNAKKNFLGETPIKLAQVHRVFQAIKLCQDRWDLRGELGRLREVRLVRGSRQSSRSSSRDGSRNSSRGGSRGGSRDNSRPSTSWGDYGGTYTQSPPSTPGSEALDEF